MSDLKGKIESTSDELYHQLTPYLTNFEERLAAFSTWSVSSLMLYMSTMGRMKRHICPVSDLVTIPYVSRVRNC